ncbi:DapH/DapD/GlmU-related protein [Psychroserpens sp.]|nr:DapH/DapD/GlmU-related protein [Psychroserpens sp.]
MLVAKGREISDKKKNVLIESIQSVGDGFCLNGDQHFISDPNKMIVGSNVHIGNNSYFKTEGGFIIGDNTHISRNTVVYTVNHDYEGTALPYDSKLNYKPVIIGKNVWIGMNVSIVPGVTIGDGAIIGLGTVVNRDVEPFEIVGSGKAITLKKRDLAHYDSLENQKRYGGVDGKAYERHSDSSSYLANRDKVICFVLSTGRSGSKTITKILNQDRSCHALHEDIHQLIRISTQLSYDPKNVSLKNELDAIFAFKTWPSNEGQVLIHSDQRLWNLVSYLSENFPNAKFIHLKREATSCIRSMLYRDWYQPNEYPKYNNHDWAMYRLQGDKLGVFSTSEWNEMTPLEKCTWYYSYVNSNIEASLKAIPGERHMYIEVENLSESIKDVQRFLNLDLQELNVVASNTMKKEHGHKQINENDLNEEITKAINKFN